MPVIPEPVGKWKYRRVQFGEVPSDVRAEWYSHGPSQPEIRAEFEPKVQDMMLDIALALRTRWQDILCNLAAELAPDERSRLFFRVALARHWEGGRIFIAVRYRDDLPPASEMDEEPSGEDGYVLTKCLVVSPVTAKLNEWLRGGETEGLKYLGVVLRDREASRKIANATLGPVEFGKKEIPWHLFKILLEARENGIHRNAIEDQIPKSLDYHKGQLLEVIEPLQLDVDLRRGIWRLVELVRSNAT